MAINRKSYASTIAPADQPGILKCIVANTTMRGYLHIVGVRQSFDQLTGKATDHFVDLLIHPDRAGDVDIQKFDAFSIQGTSPRNAPGEPRENTVYQWANGVQPIGKHLVDRQTDGTLVYAGVGVYALASGEPEELDPSSELPKA